MKNLHRKGISRWGVSVNAPGGSSEADFVPIRFVRNPGLVVVGGAILDVGQDLAHNLSRVQQEYQTGPKLERTRMVEWWIDRNSLTKSRTVSYKNISPIVKQRSAKFR